MARLGDGAELTPEELEELMPVTNGHDHTAVLPQVQQTYAVPPQIKQPEPPRTVDHSKMIMTIAAMKGVLNARLLALLSVLGTLGGFGFCMYDPTALRLWGLGIYAVLCQAPILALYMRKG